MPRRLSEAKQGESAASESENLMGEGQLLTYQENGASLQTSRLLVGEWLGRR